MTDSPHKGPEHRALISFMYSWSKGWTSKGFAGDLRCHDAHVKSQSCYLDFTKVAYPGIIICMCPSNERWCYSVTPLLIGWVYTQNDPCLPKQVSHKYLLWLFGRRFIQLHDDVIEMETFSALLAICADNSPVTGEFPAQRTMTRSFDIFFDLRLNKQLSKQSWGWWFEMPLCPLWLSCNGYCQWHIINKNPDLGSFVPLLAVKFSSLQDVVSDHCL